jgi:hypothetical protein
MKKTVEQLKIEAEAAQQALREAEQAAKDAEREEKIKLERAKALEEAKKRQTKKVEILTALHKVVKTTFKDAVLIAPEVEDAYQVREPAVQLHKDQVYPNMQVQARHTGDQWRPRFVGWGIAVSYESYGKTVVYPELKNGGYSYDKIVKKIQEHLDIEANAKAHKEMAAQKLQTSEYFATMVKTQLGLKADSPLITGVYESGTRDYRGRWNSYTERPTEGKVFVNVGRRQCTPEQAAILVEALTKIQQMEARNA